MTLTLPFLLFLAAAPSDGAHRFGLFVAKPGPMLYAQDDAKRLHELFIRVGGLRPEDAQLITENSKLGPALEAMEQRVAQAKAQGEKTTLIVWYSGDSLSDALGPRGSADFKISLLDICCSAPPSTSRLPPSFEFTSEENAAVMVSRSADEKSHESDVIGASYFAYHLGNALLGAGDTNGDGRVSLLEALSWATDRTLAGTPQADTHPAATFNMAHGEEILSDYLERGEGLRLPARAPAGLYVLVDGRGVVVGEFVKKSEERKLALPPGRYIVKIRQGDRLRLGTVDVDAGRITTIDESSFQNAKLSEDPVKGTGVRQSSAQHWSLAAVGQYQLLFDRPTNAGGSFPSAPLVGAEATLHHFLGENFALSIDGSYGWTSGSVTGPLIGTLPYNYSVLSFGVALFHEWGPRTTWVPFAGIHLSYNIMAREFVDPAFAKQSLTTLTPGGMVGLKVRLTQSISFVARVRAHYILYTVDEVRSLGSADFGGMLDYEF